MSQLTLQPQEATKIILKKLPSRRMRDVIEKRFGLKGGRKTLEAVGREYKITRERVRQIEADALKHLYKDENIAEIRPTLQDLQSYLVNNGGVMASQALLSAMAPARYHPHLTLLLDVGKEFDRLPESEDFHERWTTSKEAGDRAEKVMTSLVKELGETGRPVKREALLTMVGRHAQEMLGEAPELLVLESYLGTSKAIGRNPYGEYGLASWSTVSPRGVRDKAYLVLEKNTRPLHFREVAKAINKAGWSKRRAHPQTVHNELIKDSRFVLVGRGLYALREWGYEPGTVGEILVAVLRGSGRPMPREEVVRLVSERRFVKPQTILLNLQNRSLFRKTDDGKYMLA